ncbi:Meiotic nuclear division protein 1 homolog [Lemmus lemmus]
MSVKDVLQSLVDDGMVDCERIGTSNYYWAFPSKALHARTRKLKALNAQLLEGSQKHANLQKSIEKARIGRQETEERAMLVKELSSFRDQRDQLKAEVEKYRECDPQVVEEIRQANKVAKEAANRWTGHSVFPQPHLPCVFLDIFPHARVCLLPHTLQRVQCTSVSPVSRSAACAVHKCVSCLTVCSVCSARVCLLSHTLQCVQCTSVSPVSHSAACAVHESVSCLTLCSVCSARVCLLSHTTAACAVHECVSCLTLCSVCSARVCLLSHALQRVQCTSVSPVSRSAACAVHECVSPVSHYSVCSAQVYLLSHTLQCAVHECVSPVSHYSVCSARVCLLSHALQRVQCTSVSPVSHSAACAVHECVSCLTLQRVQCTSVSPVSHSAACAVHECVSCLTVCSRVQCTSVSPVSPLGYN